MKLYTCPAGKHGANDLLLVKHPCGRAAKALDQAGHAYELQQVGGFRAMPWTRRGKREEIRELTGQEDVPVLLLDSGEAIAGTGAIVDWAKAHPVGAASASE